ncbi:MAG TPA: hypothetical protein VHO67_18510 [Polyangia bacterium]|nr:hypothetical protein [Polyangia bacterium]
MARPEVSPTPSFFDVNKYRADPGNPGAISIPGTNVALYVGGFAQLDVIDDFEVIGSSDQFQVASIPVGGGTGDTGFALSARQSRVFIETDAPWEVAPLLAYVELDFFDPQNQSDFHLRHAFGAIGRAGQLRLVVGQTFTTFMDATVIPNQLDYAGPSGLANVIQAQARLMVPFARHTTADGASLGLEWDLAIEAPDAQFTVPMGTQATSYSRWPDLVTALRWDHAHGHMLVSGVFRQLGIFPAGGDRTAALGYGGNFTGTISHFWGQDHLLWAIGGGRGVSSYFAGSNGQNLDAFLTATGTVSTTAILGAMGSYSHFFWSDRFAITATYSILRLFDLEAGGDATLDRLQYAAGMLQYFPNKRFMTGVQVLFGQRRDRNGESASDDRLQLSAQIRF